MTRDKADLAVIKGMYKSFCFSYRSPRKFMPSHTVVDEGLIFCLLHLATVANM